jgi:uncharacterized protein with LGFP repeats
VVQADGGGGVRIVGSRRTVRVDGWDIRSALGLRDTLFSINIIFTVDSRLLAKFRALDGATGKPVSDVYSVPRGQTSQGVAQNFEKGRLTYRSRTGKTVWQFGSVLRKYDELGREGGQMGMPASDVFGGEYKAARYANGWIVRSPSAGSHVVMRKFARTYDQVHGPRGPLGLPTRNREPASSVAPGGRQRFQEGAIYRNPKSGRAYALWGRINGRYLRTGGGGGPCGNPTSNVHRVDVGWAANFQHGTIRLVGDAVKVSCG